MAPAWCRTLLHQAGLAIPRISIRRAEALDSDLLTGRAGR